MEAALEQLAAMNWHPARKLSVIHHEDIATALKLALTGVMDGRIVNIADESPLTAYEIAQIVGSPYDSSGDPLANPWLGHMEESAPAWPRRLVVHLEIGSCFHLVHRFSELRPPAI